MTSTDARRLRYDRLMAEADHFLGTGDFAEAVKHYAAAAELARDGGAMPELATALHRAAIGRDRADQLREALWFAEQALQIDESFFGPVHPAVARDLHSLGVILARSGKPADAVPHLQRSADISARSNSPREQITTLLALGQAFHTAEEPVQAAVAFSQAAEVATTTEGPRGRHAVRAMLSMASALAAAGQLGRAHTTWAELTRRLAGQGTPPPAIAVALAQAWQGLGTLAHRGRNDTTDAGWMYAFAHHLAPVDHPVRDAARAGMARCPIDAPLPTEPHHYVVVAAPEAADRFDVASPTGGRFTVAKSAVEGEVRQGQRMMLRMGPSQSVQVSRVVGSA
jgi:tetratricopeptide (TPR) repeat protein